LAEAEKYRALSDADFIKSCIVGASSSELPAWHEFYRRFFGKFRTIFARFRSIPATVALDLSQEAFIHFSGAAQGNLIQHYEKLDAYLESIALNEARDYFRQLKRQRRVFQEKVDPETLTIPIEDSPLERMIFREMHHALRKREFLSSLSKREYQLLHWILAKKHDETVQLPQDISQTNLYAIRSRLKRKILKYIEEM